MITIKDFKKYGLKIYLDDIYKLNYILLELIRKFKKSGNVTIKKDGLEYGLIMTMDLKELHFNIYYDDMTKLIAILKPSNSLIKSYKRIYGL